MVQNLSSASGYSAPRDRWAGKVYISHGGGKAEITSLPPALPIDASTVEVSASTNKPTSMVTSLHCSQEETDRSIRALIKTWKEQKSFLSIIGSGYDLADFAVPHRYCVLGW